MTTFPPLSDLGVTLAVISHELEEAKAAGDFDAVFQLGYATKDLVDRAAKRMASRRSAELRSSEAAARTEWYLERARTIWERRLDLRRSIDRTSEIIIDEIKKLPPEEATRLLRGKSTIRRAIKSS